MCKIFFLFIFINSITLFGLWNLIHIFQVFVAYLTPWIQSFCIGILWSEYSSEKHWEIFFPFIILLKIIFRFKVIQQVSKMMKIKKMSYRSIGHQKEDTSIYRWKKYLRRGQHQVGFELNFTVHKSLKNIKKIIREKWYLGSGSHLGLYVILNGDVTDYYCSSTNSAGFKILLHNPIGMRIF